MNPVPDPAASGPVTPPAGRRRTCAAGAVALTAATLALAPFLGLTTAQASPHLIQPAGATFAAAFPSSPRAVADDATAARRFPGATSASAYWVSPGSGNILASKAPVPHTDTYLVVAARYPTSVAAIAYVDAFGRAVPALTRTSVAGRSGYGYVGREASPLNKGSRLTQPKAAESLVVVPQGDIVYEAIAITSRRATAVAFTRSLRVTSPVSSALSAGASVAPRAVPAAAVSSSSSHKLRDGAIIVVGLALIALGLAFKRQGSISLGHTRSPKPVAAGPSETLTEAPAERMAEVVPPSADGTPPAPVETVVEEPELALAAVATTSSRTVLPLPPPPPPVPAPQAVESPASAPAAAPSAVAEVPAGPARVPLSEYVGTPDILPGR